MSNIRDQLLDMGRALRDHERRLGRTERIEKSAPVTARLLGLGLGARITHSVAQSIASGTGVSLSFDTSQRDTDGYYSSAAPTRLTVPTGLGGEYLVSAHVEYAANATGHRHLFIRLNGVTALVTDIRLALGSTLPTRMSVQAQVPLAAGDYVEVRVFQDSGGALSVTNTTFSPRLTLVRVG